MAQAQNLRGRLIEKMAELNGRDPTGDASSTAPQEAAIAKAIVLDTMAELVAYQNRDMQIVWANRAAREQCGMDLDAIREHKCYEAWHQRDEVCPECPATRALQSGCVEESEISSRDGRLWLMCAHPIHDSQGSVIGTVEVAREITESKAAEQALRASEEKANALLNAATDTSMLIDPSGIVLAINDVGAERLGKAVDDVLGHPVFDFMPKDVAASRMACAAKVIETRKPQRMEDERQGIVFDNHVCPIFDDEGNVTRLAIFARDITEQRRMAEALEALSLVDDLTGLYNRRGFFTLAEAQLRIAKRSGTPLYLLYADVDGLKAANDTFGHLAGDKLLFDTARTMRNTLREADIMARIGGDEFVALLTGADAEGVAIAMARLRESAEATNTTREGPERLSLSMGFAVFDPKNPSTIEDLLNRADRHMYETKREGNGQ